MAPPEAATGLLARLVHSSFFKYLVLSAQLAFVLWIIRWYSLEGLVFGKLAVLVWAGFSVHYFLPSRARLPFFGLLSVAGILVIFGPSQGAWLLALGLAVIGLCHLPVPFGARVAILLAAAVLLCLMRAGRFAVPWSAAIWPVLGSMFALRLVIYLYDLKHRSAPFSFWRSLAYFFMLPNVAFPLFPVVDYQTLCRTHDADKDRARVYQTGLDWMVRGTLHLLLYRLIYQNLPIDTSLVLDVPQLLRYLLWPFLLYLHVSGLFHLVVGMLHLFGFNLPETHHLFYLASSFTDFWRRINIYWKDFMMKVFYYPAFFQLRRLGNNAALVLGTFAVFFATWVLHSWQWFWLRGSFLVKGTDVLFWTILAVLVSVNVLLEANRPMARRLTSSVAPWGESVRKAVQALGVFACICVLWSLWVSDSAIDWLSLFSVLRRAGPRDFWLVPALLGLAAVFLLMALYYERRKPRPFGFYGHAFQSGGALLALFLASSPRGHAPLGQDVAIFFNKLKSPGLTKRDVARRQRDYYEKLNDVGWENPELARLYRVRPADWNAILNRADLARPKAGLPYMAHLPNAHGQHRGTEIRFNRWGLRDRDYPLKPQPGSYRIALVGQSVPFGSGVAQEEIFESLTEDRLNREDRLGSYERVEILNFAAENYTPLDVLATTEQKILAFQPHALLYVVHTIDAHRAVYRLSKLLDQKEPLTYPELFQFAQTGGVGPGTQENVAMRALLPRKEALLAWAYRQIVDRCRSHVVVPILVHLPLISPQEYELPVSTLLAIGRQAGFLTLDLSGVYDGHDPEKIRVAPWDDHPNVSGHRLVADRLHAAMVGIEDSLWRRDEKQRRDQGSSTGLHP